MRLLAGLALLAALLTGCVSIVQVRTAEAPPKLSVWLGGVRIQRGANDAIGVRQWSAGAWTSCYAAGVGVAASFCVVVDVRSCGVAVMDQVPAARLPALAKISDQTRAICLHSKKDPK